MWCSSPWPKPEPIDPYRRAACQRAALTTLAGAGLSVLPVLAQTTPAPGRAPLVHQGLTLWPRGEGRLRFFGLHLYTAQLWAAEGFNPGEFARSMLALELTYARPFTAVQIAQRSLEEMTRQSSLPPQTQSDWQARLASLLPDVQSGDRLLGIHRPGRGAWFQTGAQPDARALGEVNDPQFSALFFGIWLSAQTSEPALRNALLAGR